MHQIHTAVIYSQLVAGQPYYELHRDDRTDLVGYASQDFVNLMYEWASDIEIVQNLSEDYHDILTDFLACRIVRKEVPKILYVGLFVMQRCIHGDMETLSSVIGPYCMN